ncbi:Uncharacterised protein [Mycobacteroides abscessus]|nr:Uncharacterised protein [Mycobacteroides abscessus]
MTMAATGAPTITGMTADPIGDPIAVTTGTVKTPQIRPARRETPTPDHAGRATYLFAAKNCSNSAAHSCSNTPPRTSGRCA